MRWANFWKKLYTYEIFLTRKLTCLSQIYIFLLQARIQRFKEVSQTDYVPGFPLAAAWISRSTSIMICVELSTLTHWLGAYQCKISWRLHLSGKTQYLKYWLTSILQNINKFSAGHTRPILTNTKSSRSHEFCPEFCGIF